MTKMRFEEELILKHKERVDHINKSIENPIEDYLEKARAGIYANTPENRKLGRVGQKYGEVKQEEDGTESVEDTIKKLDNISETNPESLSKVLPSDTSAHKREIDKNNYYRSTRVVFEKVKWGDHARNLFNELKEKDGFEFTKSPNAGGQDSQYLVDKKNNIVYRISNHWGRVASCEWKLDKPLESWQENRSNIVLAKANFSDFSDLAFERFSKNKASILEEVAKLYYKFKQTKTNDVFVKNVENAIKQSRGIKKGFETEDVDIIKSLNTIIESFLSNSISEDILMKAMAGVYSDTPENKKLGRVGQKFGNQAGEKEDKPKQGGSEQKVTGVDFKNLERFNLNEEYVNKLVPHLTKNIDATKKFIQNLDKLADKLSEKTDNKSYNEAKNLRNLKVYLLHQMFK